MAEREYDDDEYITVCENGCGTVIQEWEVYCSRECRDEDEQKQYEEKYADAHVP